MKLYTALKLKKKLVGEIAKLKLKIQSKNSYLAGSTNEEKYDVRQLEVELTSKVGELLGLKVAINEANLAIQKDIYELAETKGLLIFWQGVNTQEGVQESLYNDKTIVRKVQLDEKEVEQRANQLQGRIDAIQESIDAYNYTTDILV